jgi:hypothetical protein
MAPSIEEMSLMMTLDLKRNEMQLEASKLETKSKDLASLQKLLLVEEGLQAIEKGNLETERHLLKAAVKTENKRQLANKEAAARREVSLQEREASVVKAEKNADKKEAAAEKRNKWVMNDENRARRLMQEARNEKVAMKELMEQADGQAIQEVRKVKEEARRRITEAEDMMQRANDGHQRAEELAERSRVEQQGWKSGREDLEEKLANALDNIRELSAENRKYRDQTRSLREQRLPKAGNILKPGPASQANIPTSLVGKVLEHMRRSPGERNAAGTTPSSLADTKLRSVNGHVAVPATKKEHEHKTTEFGNSRPTGCLARSPALDGQANTWKAGTAQAAPIGPGPLFQPTFMGSTEEILSALLPAGGHAEWKVAEPMTMIVVAKEAMAEIVKEKLDANGFDLDTAFQTEEDCKFKRWANANDFREGNKKILVCSLQTANQIDAYEAASYLSIAFLTKDMKTKKAAEKFLLRLCPHNATQPRPRNVLVCFRNMIDDKPVAQYVCDKIQSINAECTLSLKELAGKITSCIGTVEKGQATQEQTFRGLKEDDEVSGSKFFFPRAGYPSAKLTAKWTDFPGNLERDAWTTSEKE